MKPSVTPAATAKVLAGIDRTLGTTAEAVERVLQTATPGLGGDVSSAEEVTSLLCEELGLEPLNWLATFSCEDDDCPWCNTDGYLVVELPGFRAPWMRPSDAERDAYAPWVISPHLFATEGSGT